eukprot:TRINITY_DN5210_c0_g3_i1.p1 TRINITY_DN5210_c0_g3~~TRINITY_DN5210_c0_g3_i1.p1  ORF type:complete len:514 (-),score=127.00 TRINITY_DN5210_c0_g3_i1:399-1940(-)
MIWLLITFIRQFEPTMPLVHFLFHQKKVSESYVHLHKAAQIHFQRLKALEKTNGGNMHKADDSKIKFLLAEEYTGCFDKLIHLELISGDTTKAFCWSETSRASALCHLLQDKSQRHNELLEPQDIKPLISSLNQTVLFYAFTDGSNQPEGKKSLYVWVFSPEKSDTLPVFRDLSSSFSGDEGVADLVETIQSCSRVVRSQKRDSVEVDDDDDEEDQPVFAHLRKFYDILIAPIKDLLPPPGSKLLIIPDGPLFHLPFAALIKPSHDLSTPNYMCEDYAIEMSFSLRSAVITRNRRKVISQTKSLCSNPLLIIPSVPDLPGAASEVEKLVKRLKQKSLVLLSDDKVTKSNIKEECPHASLVHIPTHGSTSAPRNFTIASQMYKGGLLLTANGSATSTAETGPHNLFSNKMDEKTLWATEIRHFPLSCCLLVVLSACNTGLGVISNDGVGGLVRAFFVAGSGSVLASLTPVPDQFTEELITLFYDSCIDENQENPDSFCISLQVAMKKMAMKISW